MPRRGSFNAVLNNPVVAELCVFELLLKVADAPILAGSPLLVHLEFELSLRVWVKLSIRWLPTMQFKQTSAPPTSEIFLLDYAARRG